MHFRDKKSYITIENMDEDVYQMVADFESGNYESEIADPNFSASAVFGANSMVAEQATDSIYKVEAMPLKDEYMATRISFYSLEKEEQGTLYDVVIMCRVVYTTAKVEDDTAYHIITVKGGVVKTTNQYIVDALYLKSTGSGNAFNSSGLFVGLKFEGRGYTEISGQPVTGKVYSISSGLKYYYCPGVGGGGTAGFCKGIVSAAHYSDQHDLEVGCGWA